ncbi:protocadherin-9-like [Saccostrea echinata]|uniref:protocadherin-9-like n=1 Tax=Saccostrea echinata TaxID=191078 RepID=UPI002A7F57AF|nr:protocadherin-9-like [Saccostrea echinata]
MLSFAFLISCACIVHGSKTTLHVVEESDINTLIGHTGDGILQTLPEGAQSDLVYSMIGSGEHANLVKLNKQNGYLYTAELIDRESTCGNRETCSINLKVALYSPKASHFEIVDVEIQIDDVNDHAPRFLENRININVPESTPTGTIITTVTATDRDSTEKYRNVTYKASNADVFGLQVTKNKEGIRMASLILLKDLNRESRDSYNVAIIASDGGKTSDASKIDIDITVTDTNDNSPRFEHSSYNVSVQENVTIGTVVLTVRATDPDLRDNGRVSYRLSGETSFFGLFFMIDESSGDISVKEDLTRISGETFQLEVISEDHGKQPLASRVNLTVSVKDVVNNAPVIDVNILSRGGGQTNDNLTALVPESQETGNVVAFITVTDRDIGMNGNVSCSISSAVFELQNVPSSGYIIVSKIPLDREINERYDITVMCADAGIPPLSSTVSIAVLVQDMNDNPPVFSKKSYFTSIIENNAPGIHLVTVSATDEDLGENAQIEYFIQGKRKGLAIDSKSGVLRARTSFDREKTSEYEVTVVAVDSGWPSLTATTTVFISILDANDNAPSFKVSHFQFFVLENMPAGMKVGQLSATDKDVGVNGNLLFSVIEGYKNTIPFIVFQDGIIKTSETLDREEKDRYSFQVKVYDLGSPSFVSTADVTVRLADNNDNAPVITYPAKENETVIVFSTNTVGSTVAVIQAKDADESGPNSDLEFSIISGNDEGVFAVDNTFGTLRINKERKLEEDESYLLHIRVSDKGYNKKSVDTKLKIILKYVNGLEQSGTGPRNAMVTTSVVAITVVAAVVITTILCIFRRNAQKKKKEKQNRAQSYKQSQQVIPIDAIVYKPTTTKQVTFTEKKVPETVNMTSSTTDHEDLDNMELYNSTGTSMFTNSLIECRKMMTDEDSDDSDCRTNCDSGKGGSYLDIYKLNRMRNLGYFGPKRPPLEKMDVMDII